MRRWIEDVAQGLDPSLIKCALICATERDATFKHTVDELRHSGIKVWTARMQRQVSPAKDTLAALQIARILRDNPCDVIHAHCAKAGMLVRLAAPFLKNSTIVYTPHAFPFQARSPFRTFYYALEKAALNVTDYLLAVSESERQLALNLGYSPTRTAVVRNGIDPRRFEPSKTTCQEGPTVGSVTSFRPQKDNKTLLSAFKLLKQAFPQISFTICGGGARLEEAKKGAEDKGMLDSVTFTGLVSDVRPFVENWHVFVFSTHFEGMPYALLEAMAAQKPIVASRVPGVEEVISHGQTGLLVPPGDCHAMAQAVTILLRDRPLAQRLAKAARETVIKHYSLDRQLKKLTDFYLGITESNLHEERY